MLVAVSRTVPCLLSWGQAVSAAVRLEQLLGNMRLTVCCWQVLKLLYDKEIVAEEAILAWADEKESAEAHERTFLKR